METVEMTPRQIDLGDKQCGGIWLRYRHDPETHNRLFYALTETLNLRKNNQAKWHPYSGHGYGWQFFEKRDFKNVVNALKVVFREKWRYRIFEMGWGWVVDIVFETSRDWDECIDPSVEVLVEVTDADA